MQEVLARGICIQDSKILLAYFKEKDYFFLPGGHVELGESAQAALQRELHEELDLDVVPGKVISVFEHSWMNKDRLIHEINFLITFSVPKEVQLISQVGHLDFKWVDVAEFESVNFLPEELKETITGLLKGGEVLSFISSLS